MKTFGEIILNKNIKLTNSQLNIITTACLEYSEQFKPEWVPCTIRLPNTSGSYLFKLEPQMKTVHHFRAYRGIGRVMQYSSPYADVTTHPSAVWLDITNILSHNQRE